MVNWYMFYLLDNRTRLSSLFFFFLMIRLPPISTLTDTLLPYTTLFRSDAFCLYLTVVYDLDEPFGRERQHRLQVVAPDHLADRARSQRDDHLLHGALEVRGSSLRRRCHRFPRGRRFHCVAAHRCGRIRSTFGSAAASREQAGGDQRGEQRGLAQGRNRGHSHGY